MPAALIRMGAPASVYIMDEAEEDVKGKQEFAGDLYNGNNTDDEELVDAPTEKLNRAVGITPSTSSLPAARSAPNPKFSPPERTRNIQKAGPTSDVIQEWKVGDRIEGNFEGQGLFYPGAISKVRFWPLFFENSSAVVLIFSGCSNVV